MEAEKYDKIKYNNQYNKEHYARLTFLVPKHEKREIKDYYAARGVSVNYFVVDLIRRAMAGEI